MKADVRQFEVLEPASLTEALHALAAGPARPLAGGTDLMVMLAAGKLPAQRLMNLWQLSELRGLHESPTAITLGALTTFTDVLASPTLRHEFPMLCQGASETGGLAIQNRGTLGGNIANASPAADSPPALMAYDAEVELCSMKGARWVRYRDFHTGYKQMVMRPDELIARIRLTRSPAPRVHFYQKVGPRRAQAISKVCFAGTATLAGGRIASVGIALGGVAPIVLPCRQTEAVLTGADPHAEDVGRAAVAALSAEIAPIDDVRSTARYRRRVAENLTREFLDRIRRHSA